LIEEKVRKIRDVAAEAARIRNTVSDSEREEKIPDRGSQMKASGGGDGSGNKGEKKASAKNPMVVMSRSGDSEDESEGEDQEREMRCRLVLTCFAPEGSPLIGLGASL
jgi:hypothetical protein